MIELQEPADNLKVPPSPKAPPPVTSSSSPLPQSLVSVSLKEETKVQWTGKTTKIWRQWAESGGRANTWIGGRTFGNIVMDEIMSWQTAGTAPLVSLRLEQIR